MSIAAIPAGLLHQALDRFFLGPALLDGDVGEIGGSMPPTSMRETDSQTMESQRPVHDVVARLEVRQQSERAGKCG